MLLSGGDSTDAASLSASVQEGLFSSSLRQRHSSDHGYGSLGHGHGAWLSSSPHPSLRGAYATRPPLYRSPSMQVRLHGLDVLACGERAECAGLVLL